MQLPDRRLHSGLGEGDEDDRLVLSHADEDAEQGTPLLHKAAHTPKATVMRHRKQAVVTAVASYFTIFALAILTGSLIKWASSTKDPQDVEGLLWPVPQQMSLAGTPIAVCQDFAIETNTDASPVLNSAVERYRGFISRSASSPTDGISKLTIAVQSASASVPRQDTDVSYVLTLAPGSSTVSVTAPTPFGALYALETFSQLVVNGSCRFSNFTIRDSPAYPHRGVMVDAGRRFYPLALLKSTIDAMSFNKMNVLHWHSADWGATRIASSSFPELTAHLDQQFYSAADVAEIVQYAALRGVRVMLEVDIPGHSSGFLPLTARGAKFCYSDHNTFPQLQHDSGNVTIGLIKQYLTDVISMFQESLVHFGGDETTVTTDCPLQQTAQFEQEVQQHISSLGHTPVGWNEIVTTTHSALPSTVIQSWKSADFTGYNTIVSPSSVFYLDHSTSYDKMYVNITRLVPGNTALGGEVAMWSDEYCATLQCGALNSTDRPSAWWMSQPKYDAVFSQSVSRCIWPRAAAAAGSFWKFDPAIDPASTDLRRRIANVARRLEARGGTVCGFSEDRVCLCSQTTNCGESYTPSPSPLP